MTKKVWQLTERDLKACPAWVFPMLEDNECDEATVRPALECEVNDPNSVVIVRCTLTDSEGSSWPGFMTWCEFPQIQDCQPLMWKSEEAVGFWFGITVPRTEELPNVAFPINAISVQVYDLAPIEVVIPGYCYIDLNGKIGCVS